MESIQEAGKLIDAGQYYNAEKLLKACENSDDTQVSLCAKKVLVYMYTITGETLIALTMAENTGLSSKHLIELYLKPITKQYSFKNETGSSGSKLVFIGSQFNNGPCVKFMKFLTHYKQAAFYNIGPNGFHSMFKGLETHDLYDLQEEDRKTVIGGLEGRTIIDLTGYMGETMTDFIRTINNKNNKNNRLYSYLGFPNSIEGFEYIDSSFLNYYPIIEGPKIRRRKQTDDLIFGCFARIEKLSDEVLKEYGDLLDTDDRIVLLFKNRAMNNLGIRNKFYNRLRENGVNICRVRIEGPDINEEEYLKNFNKIDLLLDSYPYSGTTVTCDALYMGCPVYCSRLIDLKNNSPHVLMTHKIIDRVFPGMNKIGAIDLAEMYKRATNCRDILKKKFMKAYMKSTYEFSKDFLKLLD